MRNIGEGKKAFEMVNEKNPIEVSILKNTKRKKQKNSCLKKKKATNEQIITLFSLQTF